MASSARPRVFLDTNVLFSGLHSRLGNPNKVLEAATARAIVAVVSVRVLQELIRNLRDKAPHVLGYLERFLAGTPLEIAPEPLESESQRWLEAGLGTDAPIIAAAVGVRVDHFCTGDRRILERGRAGELAGLKVVSPAELVNLLEQ